MRTSVLLRSKSWGGSALTLLGMRRWSMNCGATKHSTVAMLLTLSACSSSTAVDISLSRDQTGSLPLPSLAGGSSPEVSASGPVVRFSEIMYHSPSKDSTDEFIEIANYGNQEVSLENWCISGISHCITKTTRLSPGSFYVLYQSEFEGTLSNSGERLALLDPLDQVVDVVEYSDSPPWPPQADGGGASLHRKMITRTGVDAWAAGIPTPGEPFLSELEEPERELVISEVHYHAIDDNPEKTFIEVVNLGSEPLDLKGWCIKGVSFCWDNDRKLLPGSAEATLGLLGSGALSRSGERLRLVDPSGAVHDTVSYLDRGNWPALADGNGASLHRRNLKLSGEEPGNWVADVPSPGVHNGDFEKPLIPTFTEVSYTVHPEKSDPIRITGAAGDFVSVRLVYVVDFGTEVEVEAAISNGLVTALIPPQEEGSLVRFRLVGESSEGVEGTWPIAGDGMRYHGTVVQSDLSGSNKLPILRLFMPDEIWAKAKDDRFLDGDEGYPLVVALGETVFDNARMRIKGNQARFNKKKKWKIMLPYGYETDGGGLFRNSVDQFDLLPAATDKSFSREVLVADLQTLSGGFSQEVLPLRVLRNNAFFGLFLYGESLDQEWRDLMGLSSEVYVWKAELVSKLKPSDLLYSDSKFGQHYERITKEWIDDGDILLRNLISTLSSLPDEEVVSWVYQNVDVPQVVESLATMRIVQHSEWQHKNYFIAFDPADARWRLIPMDFDLTFGRYYQSPCNSKCDEILALPYLEYPKENRLAEIFLTKDPFRSMVDRRTRELSEIFLADGYLEQRLGELRSVMEEEAAEDRVLWGAYGKWQTMEMAQNLIIREYVVPKRRMYLGAQSALPDAQPSETTVRVGQLTYGLDNRVISAKIYNDLDIAVDISNFFLEELNVVVPPGAVVPAKAEVLLLFERRPTTKEDGFAVFVTPAE